MTDSSLRYQPRSNFSGPSHRPRAGLPPGMPPIRCLFQPIVDLATERTVGFEALTRGVDDNSAAGNSDALFEWARRTGRLLELDWACRMTAMQSALEVGLSADCGLFINVEPAALGGTAPDGFDAVVDEVRESGMAVVIEFTERSLADNTAGLLRLGDWVRDQGWVVAIDDIGADPGSLALVPLLKPEIIKLDLRLIQARTTVDVAQIVNAVNAEAGRTGALVLAEGIETERHAALAVSMGAHLGQGWYYGRPTSDPEVETAPLPLARASAPSVHLPDVPWDLVAGSPKIRRAEKVLLEAMSRHLERQAMASTDPVVVVGSFQNVEQYNASTARRFAALAASGAVVAALGRGVEDEPSAGVQGQNISSHDPIGKEWTIAVVTAHFAGALISQDCGDDGEDSERRFDYVITYDRPTVLAASEVMLRRLVPRESSGRAGANSPEGERPVNIVRGAQAEAVRHDRQLPLLVRAIASSSSGITIADATAPDLPLVYVNEGFERMTDYSAAEMLGRNCRFLQGPQTSGRAIDTLREMISSGEGGQVTLLNYRRDGTPWWNEVHLSPVIDSAGRLTHFIGIATDVSGRAGGEADPPADTMAMNGAPRSPVERYLSSRFQTGDEIDPGWRSDSAATGFGAPVFHGATRNGVPRQGPASQGAARQGLAYNRTAKAHHLAGFAADPLTGLMDRVAAQAYTTGLLKAKNHPDGLSNAVALLVCGLERIGPDRPAPAFASPADADIFAQLADALTATVGDDEVFRNSDQEFGVISQLSARNAVVEAYAVAGRIHRAVIALADRLGVSMSIGIALSPNDGDTVEKLWRSAEAALVLAEDNGPNGTRYASDVPSVLQLDRPSADEFDYPHDSPVRPPRRGAERDQRAGYSRWPSW